ncbi:MAG: division/cell wall cluster transcriptional repressor MraZ [Planctomycetales bacterium]|nr:division/cell wall cluster transcriptional repressor MraZ [Planctomycetales bacterium]
MTQNGELLLGEFTRALDERYRLSIPSELAEPLAADGPDCILVKQQAGCLSLFAAAAWKKRHDGNLRLLQAKLEEGRLDGRMHDVQQLGRLLSTRHKPIQLAGRGRLVIPDGFRQFLGVEAGGEMIIVGAAVCVELWNPTHWLEHLEVQIPSYRELFETLAN